MKRALCLLLVFALLMCVYVIGASATTTINDTLRAEMDKAGDDDLIRVNLWVYSKYMTEEEIDRQARTELGLPMWLSINQMTNEECDKYIIARRRIETQLEEDACLEFIEKYGLTDEMVNYHIATLINCNLTKEQIELFATCSEVDDMFFDDLREVPTEAPTEAPTEPKDLYRERLKEYYNLSELTGETMVYQLMSYNELYYHRDSSGEIDWALIQCYCNIASPVDMSAVVGNRVLHPGTAYYPFETTYGIYDVKNDKFIDPSWSGKDYLGGKEAYKYDGFVRAFDEIVGSGMGESIADVDYRGKGRPLGDIDNDLDLSIVDVTMIQRCEAMIAEYPATDELWLTYDYNGEHYYSDFNLDGSRDIVDATCIQRYLVGMDYPIG